MQLGELACYLSPVAHQIIQGARHRGRILTSNEDEAYVWRELSQIGFLNLRVWSRVVDLPLDWAPAAKDGAIAGWPQQKWFEGDFWASGQVVLGSPPAEYPWQDAWLVRDVGPYCWVDTRYPPPPGLTWCRGYGLGKGPKPPTVLQPPTTTFPPVPQPPPPARKKAKSDWPGFLLGLGLIGAAWATIGIYGKRF